MPKAKAGRGVRPKARSDLDKLAMSDSDNELEIDEGLLKVHEGGAADRCVFVCVCARGGGGVVRSLPQAAAQAEVAAVVTAAAVPAGGSSSTSAIILL